MLLSRFPCFPLLARLTGGSKNIGGAAAGRAAGDFEAGQRVFAARCAVCHATQPGENKNGPSLAGIAGSRAGAVPGYNFSTAMKESGITWDDANLEPHWAHSWKQDVRQPAEQQRPRERHRVSQYADEISAR